MHPVEPLGTVLREKEVVERAFADLARGRVPLRILEAGCGRRWPVDLRGIPHVITGVDLDPLALEHRRGTVGDLHEAVCGDLRAVRFGDGSFDAIYSAYVLEHIPGALGVLQSFARWLKPGGLLILKIPARDSVEGWLTRMLPFWLHVAFYRYIAERKEAGTPGHPPYPAFYDPVISRRGVRQFCEGHGLTLRRELGIDFAYHYRHLALTRVQRLKLRAITALIRAVGLLSMGALTSEYGGLLFIIEKPR